MCYSVSDYSLAPRAPFPRALEEVFYAYCWALKNCELLGSTAERVILVGELTLFCKPDHFSAVNTNL